MNQDDPGAAVAAAESGILPSVVTLGGMPSFDVEVADEVAARLVRRAEIAGLAPEALVARAVEEYLARNASEPTGEVDEDPLAWLGRYGDEDAQSARIDDLLADGFGR